MCIWTHVSPACILHGLFGDLNATTISYFMKFLYRDPIFDSNLFFIFCVRRECLPQFTWFENASALNAIVSKFIRTQTEWGRGRRLEFSCNRNVYVNTCLHAIAFLSFRTWLRNENLRNAKMRSILVVSHFLNNTPTFSQQKDLTNKIHISKYFEREIFATWMWFGG